MSARKKTPSRPVATTYGAEPGSVKVWIGALDAEHVVDADQRAPDYREGDGLLRVDRTTGTVTLPADWMERAAVRDRND